MTGKKEGEKVWQIRIREAGLQVVWF